MIRNGVLAAGNFIIDIVKMIDDWPAVETLANISTQKTGNGGGAYNVLKDLALMGVPFPLSAIGLVGNDSYGEMVVADLNALGIATHAIGRHVTAPTAFTDVMTISRDGRRTFFHNRGANKFLDIDESQLQRSRAKIFYLAYILLLDHLDELDDEQKTRASVVLRQAQELGFITAADLVSVHNPQFKTIVSASLPYLHYLFVNEFEAGQLTGIDLNGEAQHPDIEKCIAACRLILEAGVKCWVILHFPFGAVAVSKDGRVELQGSVQVPAATIVGAVGAGDAFAAGVLAALHQNEDMSTALKQGMAVAAKCLLAAGCSDGVGPLGECLSAAQALGYRQIRR